MGDGGEGPGVLRVSSPRLSESRRQPRLVLPATWRCAGFSSALPHQLPAPAPASCAGSASVQSAGERNLGAIVLPPSLFLNYSYREKA